MTKPEKRVKKLERKIEKRRRQLAKTEVKLGEARQMVRTETGSDV